MKTNILVILTILLIAFVPVSGAEESWRSYSEDEIQKIISKASRANPNDGFVLTELERVIGESDTSSETEFKVSKDSFIFQQNGNKEIVVKKELTWFLSDKRELVVTTNDSKVSYIFIKVVNQPNILIWK